MNPYRQLEHAHIFGPNQRGLLSPEYFETVAPVIVYEVLRLHNVRRSMGQGGKIARCVRRQATVSHPTVSSPVYFARFVSTTHGVPEVVCLLKSCTPTPFPASLLIDVSDMSRTYTSKVILNPIVD